VDSNHPALVEIAKVRPQPFDRGPAGPTGRYSNSSAQASRTLRVLTRALVDAVSLRSLASIGVAHEL